MNTPSFIYNVTTKFATSYQEQWLQWIRNEHIPWVLGTGCFYHTVMLRLIEQEDDEPVYALQYYAADMESVHQFRQQFEPEAQQLAYRKWGNTFVQFSSILEVVN